MAAGYPLIYAWRLNGQGGGRPLGWTEIMASNLRVLPNSWLYLNRHSDATRQWLVGRSGLDNGVIRALLAPVTRPRCVRHGQGAILYLRGINENPGATFHDMVSLRLWINDTGIVALRGRRMLSPEDVHRSLEEGKGPATVGELVVLLAERLTRHMEPVLDQMRGQLAELEQTTVTERENQLDRQEGPRVRKLLGKLRVAAVAMRRHLIPQREALSKLATEGFTFLTEEQCARLRDLANDTTHFVEDLDEIRDTAGIIQEQVANAVTEGMNDLLYKLTLVSAFFMPLSFVVGWFGSNVSGIFLNAESRFLPSDHGFAMEGMFLLLICVFELILFRKMKWI